MEDNSRGIFPCAFVYVNEDLQKINLIDWPTVYLLNPSRSLLIRSSHIYNYYCYIANNL